MTSAERRAGDRRSETGLSANIASNKLMAQVLHDARQHAAAISALTQIMDHPEGPVQHEQLLLVSKAAIQLVELLEHPLGERSAVEVLPLWRNIQNLVVAAQQVSSVRLEIDVDEYALISADPILVRRATSNLLDNAIRSAGDGGHVRFRIQQDGEHVYMVVEDSGPGFGGAPKGRSSLGLGVVFEFLGSVHGTFEIRQSELGGALLRVSIPLCVDRSRAAGGVLEGLAV